MSNGTCPTCGKDIDWGQEYCNNCRPPIDETSGLDDFDFYCNAEETSGLDDFDFYCNVDDTEWSSPNRDDIYCPKCGRYGTIIGTPNTKR